MTTVIWMATKCSEPCFVTINTWLRLSLTRRHGFRIIYSWLLYESSIHSQTHDLFRDSCFPYRLLYSHCLQAQFLVQQRRKLAGVRSRSVKEDRGSGVASRDRDWDPIVLRSHVLRCSAPSQLLIGASVHTCWLASLSLSKLGLFVHVFIMSLLHLCC